MSAHLAFFIMAALICAACHLASFAHMLWTERERARELARRKPRKPEDDLL